VKIPNLEMQPVEYKVLASNKLPQIPIILGVKFLDVNAITISLERARLTQVRDDGAITEVYFSKRTGDRGAVVEQPTTVYRNIPCFAGESGSIPSGEMVPLSIVWRNGEGNLTGDMQPGKSSPMFLLEEPDNFWDVQVVSGIIDAAEYATVLVANKGETKKKIKKGDLLGSISTIVVVDDPVSTVEILATSTESHEEAHSPPCDNKIDIREILNLEKHLTDEQIEAVVKTLNPLHAVFSSGDQDIGKLGLTKHRIELWDETPIYQRPRRLPEPVCQEIENQCQELELLDIIEPSKSAWSSPIVPVRKKDGTIRLCIDYRKLNAVTKSDKFPLPNLNDAIFGLHGMKYFTSLDLVRGYYQLPLEECSREYTAFSTPTNHWQFKRLSFGLKNAPSAFQREMQHVLAGFPRRRVLVYIDDVLIMSESFEEHLELVRKVLFTLEKHGVKIKPAKCKWFSREVEYLGHVVSADGLKKPQSYVDKIDQVPRPSTIRGLREFLGLANFQRKFVPNFSSLQKPLSEKTGGRGSKRLVWTDEMMQAFELLKDKIREDVKLTFPDYSKAADPLELYVDTSSIGCGACLAQKQDEEVKIIAYASMTFSSAEHNYSTLERELVALRWGVKCFRPFLIGTEFIIHTDHQPLIYLQNMRLIDSRLARTLEDLADFNFHIRYTPGKQNAAADALSRLYDPNSVQVPDVSFTPEHLPEGLFLLKEVSGGGDSLFQSLHCISLNMKLKKAPSDSPLRLREMLVDELINHPHVYNMKLNRSERKKLRLMRCSGQLPAIEILYAFCHLHKCVIYVHFGGSKPISYVPPSIHAPDEASRVHLQCLSGIHYNPIMETSVYNHAAESLESEENLVGDMIEEETDDDCDTGEVCVAVRKQRVGWCCIHLKTHVSSFMVEVENGTYCALLDTGAQISCVSARLYYSQNNELNKQTNYIIKGLGNHSSPILGSVIQSIKLPNLSYLLPHVFAVVSDSMMPFCIILGADFLTAHSLDLNMREGECRQASQVVDTFENTTQPFSDTGSSCFLLSPLLPVQTRQVCIGTVSDNLRFGIAWSENEITGLTSLISLEEIYKLQQRSAQLVQLKRTLVGGGVAWPKSIFRFKRYMDRLAVVDGIIVYREADVSAMVISFQVLIEVLLVIHYQMAHIGRNKLIELVKQHIWHPSLSKVAADITATCDTCQRMKVAPVIAPPIQRIQTQTPFELVAMDLVALPSTFGGYLCCLVVMDHYTKWLSAVPLRSKTSSAIASAFENRVLPFLPLVPSKVLTDNGPEFIGKEFNELLSSYGVKHIYTTPNKPSSNGLVERANRTLIELLRIQVNTQHSWCDVLPRAVIVHNNTYHSVLGQSPSDCLLREQHVRRDGALISAKVAETWKEGHPAFGTFRLGQKVLKKAIFRGNETTNKFLERFRGPYSVSKVNGNGLTYHVKNEKTGTEERAHHSQLRIYSFPPKYLVNHPYFASVQSWDDCLPDESVCSEDGGMVDSSTKLPSGSWSIGGTSSSESSENSLDCSSLSNLESSSETSNSNPQVVGDLRSLPFVQSSLPDRGHDLANMDGTPVKDTDRSQLVPLWSLDLLRETLAKCHHKPIRWSELYSRLKNEKGILEPPLHEACIPTTIKLDTGVDIDNEEEFWDVSSISGDECSFTISRNLGIPDVEESKESVHTGDMFATSTEFNMSSFSGFLHEYSSVIYNEDQPVGGGSLSMDSVLGDTLVGAEAAIDTGSQMAEHRKVVKDQILPGYPSTNKTNFTRSPVKTRASGKVEDYPLVLPRPLEYSVRKRKRIRLNTT
jgi:hypothetical protein